MINKILVAMDNSQRSKAVFNTATALAETMNASLMLLHVLSEEDFDYPILPTYAYYSVLRDDDGGMLQQRLSEYEQDKIKSLEGFAQKAIAKGIHTQFIQLNGIPGWQICELANTWSADLIVIGSRGLRGLKEMFLGSVSNYVTHHSPCSVFIVRTEADSMPHSTELEGQIEAEIEIEQEIATRN